MSQRSFHSLGKALCHSVNATLSRNPLMVYYGKQQARNNCDILQHFTTYKYRKKNPTEVGQQERENLYDIKNTILNFVCVQMGKRKKIHITGKIFHWYKSRNSMDFTKFRSGTVVYQLPFTKGFYYGPLLFSLSI